MLTLTNIQKSFASNVSPTLNGVNLNLNEGEFCVIIGSNGCGKSTLMKCISGEYMVDVGTIAINRIDVSKRNRSHLLACVTQDVNKGTIPEFSLLENMTLSMSRGKSVRCRFYQKNRSTIISLVKEMGMGLEDYIDQPLKTLSGGQRQMIALLMAMISTPKLLLLDEHTSALDPKSQKMLMDFTVKNVAKHKITTIMITHHLSDAIKYGDRLIMLHQGNIVLDIKGSQKLALDPKDLLALFHKFEDKSLISLEDFHHV